MRLDASCEMVRGRRVSASCEIPVVEDQRGIAVDVGQQSGRFGLLALKQGNHREERSVNSYE